MSVPASTPRLCWVITDGAAGNENQALALARALGHEPEVFRIAPRAPWRWFAPRLTQGVSMAFGATFARHVQSSPPAIVIGCGRQAALATRWLKQRSGDAIRVVQILDPRVAPALFDVVVAPEHDPVRGDNVITTRGALNAVDDTWLAQAQRDWPALCALPGPRTTLLLGGPNRALQLDPGYWQGLLAHLRTLHTRDEGSLLVTTSRRTPPWLKDAARQDLRDMPGVQWQGTLDGPNPYAGMLAAADRIIVTPDSVNLMSEACATRAPVWIHRPTPLQGKIGAFVEGLEKDGRVQILDAATTDSHVEPLRETARVAGLITARFAAG